MHDTNPSSIKFKPRSARKHSRLAQQPESLQQALTQLNTTPASYRKLLQQATEYSWPVWTVTIKPSLTETAAYVIATSIGVMAWWWIDIQSVFQIIGALLTAIGGVFSLNQRIGLAKVSYCATGSWTLRSSKGTVSGGQASGCYLSPFLLVLVIRCESGGKIRIPIWRDSVTGSEYSRLYLRLFLTPRADLQA